MICPYCGREIAEPWREHFFPQSIASNDWDFMACKTCNHLKRGHIVYPFDWLFEKYPPELKFSKFKRLWDTASFDKYLCIVPAKSLKQAFTERRWITTTKIFSIEERIFYGLDRLQEIYLWAENLIETDPQVQALVMSYTATCFYLLHTYPGQKRTKYKEVHAVSLYDYANAQLKGVLVLGSARNNIWRFTSSYKSYFRELMSAPSYYDMMGGID